MVQKLTWNGPEPELDNILYQNIVYSSKTRFQRFKINPDSGWHYGVNVNPQSGEMDVLYETPEREKSYAVITLVIIFIAISLSQTLSKMTNTKIDHTTSNKPVYTVAIRD